MSTKCMSILFINYDQKSNKIESPAIDSNITKGQRHVIDGRQAKLAKL